MKRASETNQLLNKEHIVSSTELIGELARARRKELALTQTDLAGLGGTGNRFIVDLEGGKPTIQMQKVLDTLNLLGLEVVIRPKTMRGL